MKKILIISETSSYIILAAQEKLEKMDYTVYIVKPDTTSISQLKTDFDAILIYADQELIEEKQALIYVKDKAVENDTTVFIVGDSSEVNEIEKIIPKTMVKTFLRPVNVSELTLAIDEHIKTIEREPRKKILVVDDSGAMLRNVKGWFEDKYQVALANSGTMAIKYLALNRPDLILLDYEMPICDGRQVLEMIRSEIEFEDIPVIFLTSKGDKESVMKVMSLKPEGYLLKNMEPQLIVKAVDDFFLKQKANK